MRSVHRVCDGPPVRLAAAVCVALAIITPAQAGSERTIRNDCTTDALRYCVSSIPKGRAAIIKCMVANRANLGAQCRRHIR